MKFFRGFVRVPEGTGFGVELDEDKLDDYRKDHVLISWECGSLSICACKRWGIDDVPWRDQARACEVAYN